VQHILKKVAKAKETSATLVEARIGRPTVAKGLDRRLSGELLDHFALDSLDDVGERADRIRASWSNSWARARRSKSFASAARRIFA
jgi:hypothetical protein